VDYDGIDQFSPGKENKNASIRGFQVGLIMPKTWLPVVETKIRVEKELKASKKTLYTVVRISIIKTEYGGISGIWLTPLATLIVEADLQYVISFTEEKLSVGKILELAPSLKDHLETARKGSKIQID
jgi:hypothetical protein